ncbi:tetratricopeptide repeat protein [Plantactinospora endophytica]|nr:tetratricopeptide repeat protein [Plantactinospora endophytica]
MVPIPRQLPAPTANFVGRTAELADLETLFEEGSRVIVVVSGSGGVGKTALVTKWADGTRSRFPDGELYVDLGAFGGDEPVHPGEALGRILRALGTPPEHVPVTLPEQVALYRSVTAERTMLILLDDAYSVAQVRTLLPAGRSGVLVTSRTRLVGLVADGARLVDLAPLREAESVLLLAKVTGPDRIEREPVEAARLAGLCAGLPIALCVAAARMAARPRLSFERMTLDLVSETHRLGRLSRADGLSVQAAFDMSYRSLTPAVAALYRRLALHPGPEFGVGVAGAALAPDFAADPGGTGPPVTEVVEALIEASLLTEVAEEQFRSHDLVRLHARQTLAADEPEATQQAVLRGMLEWYFAAAAQADFLVTPYRRRLPYDFASRPVDLPEFADRAEALAWLERERINLLGAGRSALRHGHFALAWQLSDVLWPLLLNRKHYRDRVEIDERGVEAARAWGDKWAEAVMLKRLGRIRTKLGEHEAAERHTRAAIACYRKAGDVRGSLDAEHGLADLFRDSGREAAAGEILTRLVAVNRERGDVRSTGLTLIDLGMLLTTLGRPAEAAGLLREAEGIFAEMTAIDPYNGARVLIGLAGALLGTGDLAEAERAATEAAVRMRDLGSDHEHAEAVGQLGDIARRRGNAATAREHYRQASQIFTRLGSSRAADLDRRLGELHRGRRPVGLGDWTGPATGPDDEPDADG